MRHLRGGRWRAARGCAALVACGCVAWAAPALGQGDEGASAAESVRRGDYAEGARRYEVLLQTRGPSAALLYNLGVARAEAGEHGRAIHALERAHLWSPDDAQVLADLETVRQRVRVERVSKGKGARLTEGDAEGVALFRMATWVDGWVWGWAALGLWLAGWGALWARRGRSEGGRATP